MTWTFATRLNSFSTRPDLFWPDLSGKPTTLQCLERAATVEGLNAVDLNYPDHLNGIAPSAMARHLNGLALRLNGFAMRYYTNPLFKMGAFTNPDPAVRREAIDLTKRGIDALMASGGRLMTLWLGQDGFDYAFQADYAQLWDLELAGIREVAEHAPDCLISLEYKPNEPRAFALLPDVATTLLAIRQIGLSNLGVTLDFAHVLYADEQPAFAAVLIARHSRLMGVHLNDGYGKRDDGLMVGSVHTVQTLELLRQIKADGYDGCLYFDTFPDVSGLDPVAECRTNIEIVQAMEAVLNHLEGASSLSDAIARQDAVASQRIVQQALLAARR